MDGDLNRLKEVKDAEGFAATLEEIMANELTNDFWTVTLPANLDSSSARNPELFAYTAAQNRLGAPVLFSHKKVSTCSIPRSRPRRRRWNGITCFPRAWLESQGVDDLKRINQVGQLRSAGVARQYRHQRRPAHRVCAANSTPLFLPENGVACTSITPCPKAGSTMSYDDFLIARRKLMAAIIRKGFESLK